MGTRGFCGFAIDEQIKITYNHFDSYPEGLGADVLAFCRQYCATHAKRWKVITQARALRLVTQEVPPTAEETQRLSAHLDTSVSGQTPTEWYCLLHNLQGDLKGYLEAGVMEDSLAFAGDSLFCEWGYLVDLDQETLEVYCGFNHRALPKGSRFDFLMADARQENRRRKEAGIKGRYYPVRLQASWPLEALPSREVFIAQSIAKQHAAA